MERFQRGLVAVILVVISLAAAHCTSSAGLPPTATSIPAASTAAPNLTPVPSTPTPLVLLEAAQQDLPKGQRLIVYTRGNELGLLDVEKGTQFPLVELEGNHRFSAVKASPTGDSVAFELTEYFLRPWRPNEFSLWRLDLQSRQVELLWEENTLMKGDFAWAPDGQKIAVCLLDYAEYEEMFQGVWLVDVPTKGRKSLIQPMVKLSTEGFVWVYRWPAWSPQGDRIAIDGGYDGHESFGYAYVMDAESGSLRLLSERGRINVWSPDGSKVLVDPGVFDAFTPWVEWILSADGQELGRFVSAEDWDDVGGIWSPDEKRVYFYSQKAVEGGTMDLSLLWNVLIDRPLRLPLADVFPRLPHVSPIYYIPTPSGTKLVFNQYHEEGGESIWAVDIASGTRVKLADGFACDVFVVGD